MKTTNKVYKLKAIGKKFGRLTVINNLEPTRTPGGQLNRWCLCVCDCGNEYAVRFSHLNHGKTKSCGCIQKTLNGKSNTRIGKLYHGMRSRCSIYHSESHLYYDKGIKICDEWLNDFELFESWCKSNGYKHGLHIDRIDGNKGYSPDNCRFVTPKENANNRYNTLYVKYKGKKESLKMLLQRLNYPNKYYTVRTRILRGWDIEKALFKEPADNYSARIN